jgi:hypothetical protein
MNFQKPPKWPINNDNPRLIARQAAFVVLFNRGMRWDGAPSNQWLCERLQLDGGDFSGQLMAWYCREAREWLLAWFGVAPEIEVETRL